MKKIAANVFYSWKTTLLGLALFGFVVYLVERDVFNAGGFSGLIEIAAGAVAAWFALMKDPKKKNCDEPPTK